MKLPNFKGRVIRRGDSDYEAQAYQYASSSHLDDGIIRPAAIIQADDDDDVIAAIKYARDNKIAVSIRTGGHQYSGASSTGGDNIQLDLGQTYKDFKWENNDCTLVTFGISFSLGEFNARVRYKNRFVPHGQCQYVNLGGHLQSGGYGQLGRSFGLISDHVQKFRVITADGTVRWVDKDEEKDKDLFFAIAGGSPGNFGVLTHATLHVFRDQDYPNSRGLRAIYPYSRHNLKAFLDIMVEMAGDDDFPADYDYCVTVMSESRFSVLDTVLNFEETYDMKYRKEGQPEIFWAPVIIVFAQWANLKGAKQEYDPTFINKIKNAARMIKLTIPGLEVVSDEEHTPISTLSGHWILPITREFDVPYYKRTYSSNSSSQRLKELKWTDWISDRIDKVGGRSSVAAQIQHFGGSNSRFFQNGKNSPTSLSWRDTRLCLTIDAFYQKHEQRWAKAWVQGNDLGVGRPDAPFCEDIRRVLWGSFDLDLSAAQKYYYDQNPEGKYERLCEIKKKYDPSGVFTPNRFCIGLPVDSKKPETRPAHPEIAEEEGPISGLSGETQKAVEDKFEKMASVKLGSRVGKHFPLWHTWCP
jgi:hypothetical protein